MATIPLDEMGDVKKVIAQLIQNFVEEEQGNRVTKNNMMALTMLISQALNGQITINPQKE